MSLFFSLNVNEWRKQKKTLIRKFEFTKWHLQMGKWTSENNENIQLNFVGKKRQKHRFQFKYTFIHVITVHFFCVIFPSRASIAVNWWMFIQNSLESTSSESATAKKLCILLRSLTPLHIHTKQHPVHMPIHKPNDLARAHTNKSHAQWN